MNIIKDLACLVSAGVISEAKSKELEKVYKKDGFEAFQIAFTDFYNLEKKHLRLEEREIEKEIQGLNKELKEAKRKRFRGLEKASQEHAKQRKQVYENLKESAARQRKIIDKETESTSRKIDEIISDAAQKIEAKILQKIREKIV